MAPALPQNIQQKLEQTLAQSRQWLCEPPLQSTPRIVSVMAPGLSNYSVLVESQRRFVVRIDGVRPSSHGLNRQTEWRTLETANRAGLAPCPRYFNPELGSLVCDFLAPDNSQEPDTADTAQLLRKIHRLPARHHRLEMGKRILRYEQQLEQRGQSPKGDLRRCGGIISDLVHDISRHPGDSVLCHNDLLLANRIYSDGKLWALDWEYCAMGSPWYDLAVVIHGDSLSSADATTLIHTYLGRTPHESEQTLLQQYGCIYRYLELLWYLALDKPVLTADTIEAKTASLINLLQQSPT